MHPKWTGHALLGSRRRVAFKQMLLRVYVSDGEITVEHLREGFAAVYYKPPDQPQLILRQRTETHDHEFPARALGGCQRQCSGIGLDCVTKDFGSPVAVT